MYFQEEQISERPYIVVFQDILSKFEMDHLIDESRPNLSRTRYGDSDVQEALANHEFKDGNKVKITHKTGTCILLFV